MSLINFIQLLRQGAFLRVFQGIQEPEIMVGDGHVLIEAEDKVSGYFINDFRGFPQNSRQGY